MEIIKKQEARNHHYKVILKDYTTVEDYIKELKPGKEKGIKYSNWLKSFESYNKHYKKTPYWIQIIFHDDDDTVLQREFNNYDDAIKEFEEFATCEYVPDFNDYK